MTVARHANDPSRTYAPFERCRLRAGHQRDVSRLRLRPVGVAGAEIMRKCVDGQHRNAKGGELLLTGQDGLRSHKARLWCLPA